MSKRDYKTSIADGMELEPLGGAGAVDKENSKTNGTQFGEGKCFEPCHRRRQLNEKSDKIVCEFRECGRIVGSQPQLTLVHSTCM